MASGGGEAQGATKHLYDTQDSPTESCPAQNICHAAVGKPSQMGNECLCGGSLKGSILQYLKNS